jgi:hypothetical protein
MFTYSGQSIGSHEGVPTVEDVAVALGRIPRLCAAGSSWWTYLHHSAALLEIALWENLHYKLSEPEVAVQALIRDAHRAVTLLWEDGRPWENEIRDRIYAAWDVPYPSEDSEMAELINRAAARAFRAEVRAFAPHEMKELPLFDADGELTSYSDQRIIDAIWGARSNPEYTTSPNAEAVQCYIQFFDDLNIKEFRRKFGYLKGFYDERRYEGRFKPLEAEQPADDSEPRQGGLPADIREDGGSGQG